MAIISWS